MIGRFLDDLRHTAGGGEVTEPPEHDERSRDQTNRNNESFLAAVPTIRKIVWRKLFSGGAGDAPDVVQKIILQLLTWRENNPRKIEEMSDQEWQSFAAKAAHHAVNRRLANGNENLIEPLDEALEIAGGEAIIGNSAAELASLLSAFWQGICQLSLRQRCALLLGSESLLVLLRLNGVGSRELAEVLELSESELAEFMTLLPLKDFQIASLIVAREEGGAKNRNVKSIIKSVSKARHKARARLQKLLSE